MELSQGNSLISSDPGTKGFDLSAGANWVYPLNYPLRQYQLDITKNALFSNTLVCLPTGLGKTLIAAVVMYNFWRWYPRGKIVFLAPTKPLVNQQIIACHDIMGIPSSDTIELTGTMNPKNREIAWFTKRVIFATPQVFQNDLEKNIAPGELVRCVVIDEAHKALGKHSYCESLRLLRTKNCCYRVLALSATPGSKIEDVCQVIKNLSISNLELRDETSPDIIPHLNKRQMDIILVALDNDLARFKEKYVFIMDRHVRLLMQYKILKNNMSDMSKGRMFHLYKEFKSRTDRPANYGQIMKTLGRCMSLSHAYELMIRHGLRAFTTFCQTHAGDIWMTDEPELQKLIDEILSFLGPFPDVCPLPDGSIAEIPQNLVFGHTKYYKLKNLLMEHFDKFAARNEETRAIVFVEYRDSVNEVYVSLLQLRPTLRPKMFVGQAGQKRKEQMLAMKAFRNNEANVLISTSVGEEGLDVGEVDLIVCFDISQSSPIRLVQRMGRTGRRRDGRIVMLVTDGREHQALKSTIAKKDTLNNKVLHSSNVVSSLYQESPRMVPADLDPVCSKMHIVLQPKTPAVRGKRKRKDIESDLPKLVKKRTKVVKNDAELPVEVEKRSSLQSSILKFLNKPTTGENSNKALTCLSQTSQQHKSVVQVSQSQSVKLFMSDSTRFEFLTLCGIKTSRSEVLYNQLNRMDETYLTPSSNNHIEDFLVYPVPDLNILDCLAFMEERTESAVAQVSEDSGSDHIDDDVYMLEHNQRDNLEYYNSNNSLATGTFNYDNLFEDSCESDKSIFSDTEEVAECDDNLATLLENRETDECQSNEQPNDGEKEVSQVENDSWYAQLFEDDSFEKEEEAAIPEGLSNEAKENDQGCEVPNYPLNRGNFESLLDISSDSDIPPSQEEPALRKTVIKSRKNFVSNAATETRKQSDVRKNIDKPSTNSATEKVPGKTSPTHRLTSEPSGSMKNYSNRTDSERISKTRLNINTGIVNKSVDLSNRLYCNDKDAHCPSKTLNTDSQRSTPKGSNNHLALRPSAQSGIAVPAKLSEDDDDVIFIGEVNVGSKQTDSGKKSIDKAANNINKDSDDEISFEKEIRAAERENAGDSNTNSNSCTLTQLLKLIDNSNLHGMSHDGIRDGAQEPFSPDKADRFHVSMDAEPEINSSVNEKKVPKGKSNVADDFVSPYFRYVNLTIKSSEIPLKSEKPPLEAELDLSDIKWDDDFENLEEVVNYSKTHASLDKQLERPSADTNYREPVSDRRDSSPLLNKKEESFKTDSDDSESFYFKNNKQVKKSSPQTAVDFNIGDYEWESDFETPANPVETLKQLSRVNNASPANGFEREIGSELTRKKLSPNFRKSSSVSGVQSPTKKLLSLKKGETSKPSTSKEIFDSDSDFENDLVFKFNTKYKGGQNFDSKTNFVLSTSRKYNVLKESRFSSHQKENFEPNLGLAGLSALSENLKNKNLKTGPFSASVAVSNRRRIIPPNHYPLKGKKLPDRNRVRSKFLDDEAEVSAGTSSGSSGEDCDLDGFISHTQQKPETDDMQIHYLQSIKDVHRTGVFHFKKPRAFVPDDEIFSQSMSQEENSCYINDSFCVSGSDEDPFVEAKEISLLDQVEKSLSRKKRKHSANGRRSTAKKRRVKSLSDGNSSEDEIEKLRKEIFEESIYLRGKKN